MRYIKSRAAAEAARGPLLAEEGTLVEPDPELGEIDEEEAVNDEEEDEEEEGPDLLLREAARIVVDMVELESDLELLKQQYAQLDKGATEAPPVE